MNVSFIVPGKPMGKQRPRVTKWGTHTPVETVNYETLVKMTYQQKIHKILEGPLKVTINAYFGIPKSTPKKYLENMKLENVFYTKKSDADNIAKIILDALNTIAFKDDSQVSILLITKKYSDVPRVEVTIEEIKE